MGGTIVPEGLALLHENQDLYSLQAARPMPLSEMNERITAFLKTAHEMTRDDCLAMLEDPEDYDS
jgi:hypothetical protein